MLIDLLAADRICFVSKNGEDLSNISPPEALLPPEAWRYEPERNCIFTLLYVELGTGEWLERAKAWAEPNGLELTSDDELNRQWAKPK